MENLTFPLRDKDLSPGRVARPRSPRNALSRLVSATGGRGVTWMSGRKEVGRHWGVFFGPVPADHAGVSPVITLTDVVKKYPRTQRAALDGVSFDVSEGEFVFVIGASGSGKSTLVRLVLAEEKVTSGSIQAVGRDIRSLRRRRIPALRREIGVVFQDYRLLPDRDVTSNVAYVLHVLGHNPGDIAPAVASTLEQVGLSELAHRLPHELSGGEQQRVAIARALVKRPALILADEPTGNLDPRATEEIVDLLSGINAEGTTVLMATHDDRVVDRMRTRVIELDEGRVVRDESGGRYVKGELR